MKPNDYILTGKSNKFIEPRLLEYHFKNYVKSCELEDVNFHALRHTFATRCVEAGFDIKTLSEILGHVNVNITLNRYVHSSMEFKRTTVRVIVFAVKNMVIIQSIFFVQRKLAVFFLYGNTLRKAFYLFIIVFPVLFYIFISFCLKIY